MKIWTPITRTWLSGGIGALLAVGAGLGLVLLRLGMSENNLGQRLVRSSYDLPFALRFSAEGNVPIADDNVLIIHIDADSERELNQDPHQPWDRGLHAQLIERLDRAGARMIVMDIVFIGEPNPEDPSGTEALLAAIRHHGKVVLGADYVQAGYGDFGDVGIVGKGFAIYGPAPAFREACAAFGIVTLAPDYDYAVREQFFDPDGTPTLAWQAATLMDAPVTGSKDNYAKRRWLNYYGPPEHIQSVSYFKALNPEIYPEEVFRDKVVFIGNGPGRTGYSGDLRDEFVSPYSWFTGKMIGGVEIHATAFLNLLRGDWLRRFPGGVEVILLVIVGLIAGYGLCLFRPISAMLVAIVGGALLAWLHYLCFSRLHVWFPWFVMVAAQIPVALGWSILLNTIKLHVEKQNLQHTLMLHLSPSRAKQILRRPELLRPGAERQEVTILFTDIANFSKITGRMDPGDLFQLLNRYFEASLRCIHATDGTVIKLIGDAIFAVWNAPFPQKLHAVKACTAALNLRNSLIEFDVQNQSLPLRTRIGLHTGEAFIGNVGSSTRFDYTAIGDSINLTSRLEGLNKFLGTDILATRDTQKRVSREIVSRIIGHFRFKGFDRIVEVHELVDFSAREEQTREWREAFERALYHFQRNDLEAAEAGFQGSLNLRGDDGPSRFYLEEIQRLRREPPSADWAGEIIIQEK